MARSSRNLTQAWFDLIGSLPAWLGGARGGARPKRPTPVEGGAGANSLEAMTGHEFERLLGEAFRLQGYQVVPSEGAGSGGGVDLVLRRDRQTFLVRCKPWRMHKVGVEIVQDLSRAMTARGAAGGFVVTVGRFSRESSAFAAACNIRLIEGPALVSLIRKAQPTRTGAPPGA